MLVVFQLASWAYIQLGTEFAKKLWGANLIVCVSMTSPCSLNLSTTFGKIGKMGAHYGIDIFW